MQVFYILLTQIHNRCKIQLIYIEYDLKYNPVEKTLTSTWIWI